ncbi:hypothetical protein TWF696_000469 [Orbilia brochopaga]|uniref:F-box domain-containing protein n=1 Tax=Orbilia brochopaga TaxID=3140254 RepID=A0AAV9VDT3_9PEZI
MLPLPAELLIEIFSHLSSADVKNLSLCSKSYRRQVLPFIFEGFKFTSPLSLKAFQDGGKFNWLRYNVRHIVFSGLHDAPIGRTLDRTQTYPAALYLFPNATDLTVPCNIHSQIQYNVLHFLFKRIAASPFYQSLKRLTLTCSDERKFSSNGFKLSDHYQAHFGVRPRGPSDLPSTLGISPPLSLEELLITTDGCFHFHRPANYPDYSFLSLYLLQPSLESTLKRLEIYAHGLKMLLPSDATERCRCVDIGRLGHQLSCRGAPGVYTGLSILKVHVHCLCGDTTFAMIAATFPNIEELEFKLLWGLAPPPPLREYQELISARRLRKLKLPSPIIFTSGFEEGLRDLVKHWVKNGMSQLEQVELLRCEAGHRGKFWRCNILREDGMCALKWGEARRPTKSIYPLEPRPWRPYLVARAASTENDEDPVEYEDGYITYPIPEDTDDEQRPELPVDSELAWEADSYWSEGLMYDYEYPGDESESSGAEEHRTRGELTWGRETSQKLHRRRKDGDRRKQSRKHTPSASGRGGRKAAGSGRSNSAYEMLEPPEDLYWDD